MRQQDVQSVESDREPSADSLPARVQISDKQMHVIQAATPLFIEYGFHETSVRMIADAADMPMGSLYQYIHTKEHLLYLAAMHALQELYPVIIRHPDPERALRDQVAELLVDYIKVLDKNRQVFKMVYRETASISGEARPQLLATESRLIGVFLEFLEAGIASGEIAPCDTNVLGINLQMFAHSWSIKGWWLKRHIGLDDYIDEQVANALRMVPFTK